MPSEMGEEKAEISEEQKTEMAWTVVVGRHRRGKRKTNTNNNAYGCTNLLDTCNQLHSQSIADCSIQQGESEPMDDPEEEERLKKKMHNSLKKLEDSDFYNKFAEQLQSPQVLNNILRAANAESEQQIQMVVYGIGSIANSEKSRLQLCLALLLKRNFSWVGRIEVFDPILSASECGIIESLGCTILTVNERGRRTAESPTLFFMPHCAALLYDNVLRANWSPVLLNRIILLGNSFGSYLEQFSQFHRSPVASTSYVLAIADHVNEFRIQTVSDDFFAAFHQTSWHFFALDASQALKVLSV